MSDRSSKPLPPSDVTKRRLHAALRVLFAASFAIAVLESAFSPGLVSVGWSSTALVLTAAALALSSLHQQLPGQNVLLAAVIIGIGGGLAHAFGTLAGIPFGPFLYTESAGAEILGVLPWAIPFLWITVILSSRGVARLALRPWRKMRVYGFWLIGLTAALAVLFDLALEPFAAHVRHFWLWQATRLPLHWHGTPITNFAGFAVVTLLLLAFATPSLINKKPGKPHIEYDSLFIWTASQALFATTAIKHQLWSAGILSITAIVVVTIFAIRGARW